MPAWAGMMPRGGARPINVPRSKALNAARRYFELTEEQRQAVDKLEADRETEAREAMEKLLADLDKKYAELAAESMSPEDKAKYEKVLAAEAERDEAMASAEEVLRAVLEEVRTEQGLAEDSRRMRFLPRNKESLFNLCLKLDPEQLKQIGELRQNRETEYRDAIRAVERPQDFRDADARRKYFEKRTEIRRQLEEESTDAMVLVLNEAQKKAFDKAAAALDAYDKKSDEAKKACDTKLEELVGKEKVQSAQQRNVFFDRMQRGRGDRGGDRGGRGR